MDRDPRAYVWDAKQRADAIAEFIKGRTLEDYLADSILRLAVERQFEIIGEALRQLQKSAPELAQQITNLEAAVRFRNLLIHGYAGIDDHIVWRTAQQSLPLLRDQLTRLLDQLGSA
jgi:uncharacterized protein with HEPN domain